MVQKTDFVATLFDTTNNPNKVTVAFTMALNALKKGHSATLILMLDAVALGKPNSTIGIDIGAPFESVSALLQKFREAGGQIAICGPCMIHNGMSASDMDPEYVIINAADVIDLLMASKGSLQIT